MRRLLAAWLALGGVSHAAEDPWRIPAEGECAAAARAPEGGDALPFPFKPGDVLDAKKAESLRGFVPEELSPGTRRSPPGCAAGCCRR